jgi:amino acid permease
MEEKEKQEVSLIGRIFCLEAVLLLMGCVSLVSGIITGEVMQLFWGGMIIVGSVVLHFVRKKDWKAHWAEQEELRRRYEERVKAEKERRDAGKQ